MTSKFWSYEEASAWAKKQGFKSSTDWMERKNKYPETFPKQIPRYPIPVYKDFLKRGGWGAFLGTGNVSNIQKSKDTVSLEKAMEWAREEKIRSAPQWRKAKRPPGIPSHPDHVWAREFKERGGWGYFLGTGVVSNASKRDGWVSFEDGRKWAEENGIVTKQQWDSAKKPKEIPPSPSLAWPEEFNEIGGWPGFLRGTRSKMASTPELVMGSILDHLFEKKKGDRGSIRLFNHSERMLRVDWVDRKNRLVFEYDGEHFHSGREEKDQAKTKKLANDNPAWVVFRLRTGRLNAVDYCHNIQISGKHHRLENDMLSMVIQLLALHAKGKTEFPNGTALRMETYVSDEKYRKNLFKKALAKLPELHGKLNLEEASVIIRSFNFKDAREFIAKARTDPNFPPAGIPKAPWIAYPTFNEDGGWMSFLGSKNKPSMGRVWRPYEEAALWARNQGLSSWREWIAKCQEPGWLPIDIPVHPLSVYPDEFKRDGGVGGWLGTGTIHNQNKTFCSYDEAAQWARSAGITTSIEWRKRSTPENVPRKPQAYYPEFNQKGGWKAFLGRTPTTQSQPKTFFTKKPRRS